MYTSLALFGNCASVGAGPHFKPHAHDTRRSMNSTPTQTSTAPTVLILGANGRLGGAAVRGFADAGWAVVAQARRAPPALPHAARWISTALDDTRGLAAAAADARAVLYAVNQPYSQWASRALADATLGMDVAERLSATLLFPGNVYNFGSSMPQRLTPDTPHLPDTPKARIRCEIESALCERSERAMRCVVLRAGDFFGGGAGAWFDRVIVKSLDRGKLVYAGPPHHAHAWAYLPDLARAFVAVAQRCIELPMFATLHFEGHTLTGKELLDAIERAAVALGVAAPGSVRREALPWGFIRAFAWAVPAWREIVELAYLWQVPHALAAGPLNKVLGAFATTPLDAALHATLQSLREQGLIRVRGAGLARLTRPGDA